MMEAGMKSHGMALILLAGAAGCASLHQYAKTEVARTRCEPTGAGSGKQDTVVVRGSSTTDVGARRASAAQTVVCEGGLTR